VHPRARTLIDELQLLPHPEGGYFREIFRSAASVQPDDARTSRQALTTIYFLLPAGAHSRWHRVASDEVWHLYEGGPLELLVADPQINEVQRVLLQPASKNAGPAFTVPALWWQAARPLDSYALAGCTVGPGFEFEDFSFLREQPGLVDALRRTDPTAAALI
jgi:predicted cupin superfamily sugar epimerase